MTKKYFLLLIIAFPHLIRGQSPDKLRNFGKASYYHDSFHGRMTSNGELYDKDDFTCAHLTLPYNTILLVTNKNNNKSVVVRVNDRGPFKRSRILDLSHAAAKKIGMIPFGVVQVKIKVMNFLNPLLMSDTLLHDGDLWDCYGHRKEMPDTSYYLWQTQNWKHAFYMASCLSLDYKLTSVNVRVKLNDAQKYFQLFISEPDDLKNGISLIGRLRTDGFFHARPYYKNSSEDLLPGGQSTKKIRR